MNQIRKKPKYRVKAPLIGSDYVVGTNSDKSITDFEFEETMSVTLDNIKNYVVSGLEPQVGGNLKITELTDNSEDFATPQDFINSINPFYAVSKYEVLIVTHKGNKYLLNKQNLNIGVDNLPISSIDLIKLNVDLNLGNGAKVYKGINIYGEKELRTFGVKSDPLIPLSILSIEETDDKINYGIDENALTKFLDDKNKTHISSDNSILITETEEEINFKVNPDFLQTWLSNRLDLICLMVGSCAITPTPDKLGNFKYSATPNACESETKVYLYRDVASGSFGLATVLAYDEALTNKAVAGYYAEFDQTYNVNIMRHWNGTNFIGSPEVCAD